MPLRSILFFRTDLNKTGIDELNLLTDTFALKFD